MAGTCSPDIQEGRQRYIKYTALHYFVYDSINGFRYNTVVNCIISDCSYNQIIELT